MFPVKDELSTIAVNKIFSEKSAPYTTNTITFYTDGSKLDKNALSGASMYSPDINLNIIHKLLAESSVFSTEVWAIYLAINNYRS